MKSETSPSMVILLDIEGTTTPISFVYEVLFPYARAHFEEFLRQHWDVPEIRREAAGLPGAPQTPETALKEALALMDRDVKDGALKALQGRIWESGYRSGRLRGQVFPDVSERLALWKQAGHSVYIYSSGSVLAQQLLFGHSEAGDLTPWIDGYFDTAVGPKQEAESYRAIAARIGIAPQQGIFATDVLREAEAACQAGWGAVLLDRPGNPAQPEHGLPILQNLHQIDEIKETIQHG